MIDRTVQTELFDELARLSPDQQRRVLRFARELPDGTRGSWREMVGTLDAQSARQMTDAIEQGCEQVDADEW